MDIVLHHRQSIRLPGYDYASAGAYFVTICAYRRDAIFGEVVKGEMKLSETGKIVEEEWYKTAEIRKEIELDEFVIMPNHFHGIVWIVGAHGNAPPFRKGTHPTANAALTFRNGSFSNGNGSYSDVGVLPTVGHVANPDGIASAMDILDSRCRSSDGAHYHAPLHRRSRSLSAWVAGFKGAITRRVCTINPLFGPIFQRNYYEHIIRDDSSLHQIRQYIVDNPLNWESDPEHGP